MKRTGKRESRPCQGMYPLQARAEPFLFVAASFSVHIARRGLAYRQVRDTELAPHRISYMRRVPSTCLCYWSPANRYERHTYKDDTTTHSSHRRKRLDFTPSEPEGKHKTRHPFSQQLTGSSRAPRRYCRAGADRKAGGGHGVGEMKVFVLALKIRIGVWEDQLKATTT